MRLRTASGVGSAGTPLRFTEPKVARIWGKVGPYLLCFCALALSSVAAHNRRLCGCEAGLDVPPGRFLLASQEAWDCGFGMGSIAAASYPAGDTSHSGSSVWRTIGQKSRFCRLLYETTGLIGRDSDRYSFCNRVAGFWLQRRDHRIPFRRIFEYLVLRSRNENDFIFAGDGEHGCRAGVASGRPALRASKERRTEMEIEIINSLSKVAPISARRERPTLLEIAQAFRIRPDGSAFQPRRRNAFP